MKTLLNGKNVEERQRRMLSEHLNNAARCMKKMTRWATAAIWRYLLAVSTESLGSGHGTTGGVVGVNPGMGGEGDPRSGVAARMKDS